MTRAYQISAFVAMGLLMAGSTATAQTAPTSTSGGQVTYGALAAGSVASSKFTEYRAVPTGMSVSSLNLFSKSKDLEDFFGFRGSVFDPGQKIVDGVEYDMPGESRIPG